LYTINRSVAIIRPKQPFVDWANSISEGEDFTVEDLNAECNAVLLPDYVAHNYDGLLLEVPWTLIALTVGLPVGRFEDSTLPCFPPY
jgi:hypothetical protein